MKAKNLLGKLRRFKHVLQAHSDLWSQSLSAVWSSQPTSNTEDLKAQQVELFRLYYAIDEYLTWLSKGRLIRLGGVGFEHDMYVTAIGNANAIMKRPSLENALLDIEGIISLLEGEDGESEITPRFASQAEKRVFISHGKETRALSKLERFLRGLGVTPIIVKHEPSLGKALDDLVEGQMGTCIAVTILATKDDKIKDEKGEEYFQPRLNVIHEIGLAQERVKARIIYLKEDGCHFPSNVAPKVWESFTQDNMEGAFLKVVKELKAFGVIQ